MPSARTLRLACVALGATVATAVALTPTTGAQTTFYPFAVDARAVAAGTTTLGYEDVRPVAFHDRFAELLDVRSTVETPQGPTSAKAVDFRITFTLPDGVHFDGPCALARYYAGQTTLSVQTDGTLSCTTSGQQLTVAVSSRSTVNLVLLGFRADDVSSDTVLPRVPYTLTVDAASYDPFQPSPGTPGATGTSTGTSDFGVAVVPRGSDGPAPTTTVAPPSPTALPSWTVAPPVPPTTTRPVPAGLGSLGDAVGSFSDLFQQVDPRGVNVPVVALP